MQYLHLEHHEYVLLIAIDRQSALNALNRQVMLELQQVIASIDTAHTRCVILTGAGSKAFVAGADIGAMQCMSKAEGKEWSLLGNDVFRSLETLDIPVIAAVNGFALGGGCELALACDIRIASETASFAQPEVCLGITPGFGASQRLPRLIGEGHAKQLLYTGERITAHKALEIGLINAIYPADNLIGKALELAASIARNAPIAVRGTKRAIDAGCDLELDSALALEADFFSLCFETEDQREGMTAMLEKRKPIPFKGC